MYLFYLSVGYLPNNKCQPINTDKRGSISRSAQHAFGDWSWAWRRSGRNWERSASPFRGSHLFPEGTDWIPNQPEVSRWGWSVDRCKLWGLAAEGRKSLWPQSRPFQRHSKSPAAQRSQRPQRLRGLSAFFSVLFYEMCRWKTLWKWTKNVQKMKWKNFEKTNSESCGCFLLVQDLVKRAETMVLQARTFLVVTCSFIVK